MGKTEKNIRYFMFRNMPIKRKLVALIIGITGVTLFLFGLTSVFTQVLKMRESMVETKSILAESIAELSTASISFGDHESAAEILSTLKADGDIELALILDEQGKQFASYSNRAHDQSAVIEPPTTQSRESRFSFKGGKYMLEMSCPIVLDEKHIGQLYVLSNTGRMQSHIDQSILLLFLSMGILLVLAIIISARLQHLITQPVSRLANAVRDITKQGDYSLRVDKGSEDEVGQLIDDFNLMLLAIQERDAELQEHRQNLEQLVEDRTEELKTKRDEALAAARAKSEFLANMSHEIRTPMNGVIGVLSLLRDAPLNVEYQRLLDTASRSADSLMLIINDILDFSKIDAGKITFESIVYDLREVVEEASELFIDTVNLKHLDLSCYIPPELPCKVQGDPTRLRQVITNLMSNAVKFTDRGEVKLQVSLVSRQENQQELLFSVEDSGIGIAEEAIGHLFDKFTQADGSTTRKYGGTGLGLSVCKQLVEQQGGTIGVDSKLGEGSTFWFTLPLTIVEETFPLIPYGKLKGKTFVVIEDSITNCLIIERYLSFCDARVHTIDDSEEHLQQLEEIIAAEEKVDAVLIDYTLPGINGLNLAAEISAKMKGAAPDLILMGTGSFTREQQDRAGVGRVLLKPVRQQELYAVLSESQPTQLTVQERKLQSLAGPYPVLKGRVLLVDDEPINQRIGLAILKKFGLHVDVASNGNEALQQVVENDYAVILMDIQMPEMSGFEATELIRDREKNGGEERSVIIAMTANALESTRQRCFEVGMDDFFTKPIKPEVLAERLVPWLTDVEESSALPPQVGQPSTSAEQEWNLEIALGFVGGDRELFLELVQLFLERNKLLLRQIEEAVVSGCGDELRDAAHAYKGAVNHFAATRVRELASSLEQLGKKGELGGCREIYENLDYHAQELAQSLQRFLQDAMEISQFPRQ